MEEKKEYQAPSTLLTQVELEEGLCAASANVRNPSGKNGEINSHEINKDFGDNGVFTVDSWETDPTK